MREKLNRCAATWVLFKTLNTAITHVTLETKDTLIQNVFFDNARCIGNILARRVLTCTASIYFRAVLASVSPALIQCLIHCAFQIKCSLTYIGTSKILHVDFEYKYIR